MNRYVAFTSVVIFVGACLTSASVVPAAPDGAGLASLTYAQSSGTQSGERAGEQSWETVPADFDEVARHGFHDGVAGARKDFDKHRKPDVNRHGEYRRPPVPDRDHEGYKLGYERGYQAGVDHLMVEHTP